MSNKLNLTSFICTSSLIHIPYTWMVFFPRLVTGRCMTAQPSENWRLPVRSHQLRAHLTGRTALRHWYSTLYIGFVGWVEEVEHELICDLANYLAWHWHRSWHSSNRSRTRLLLTTINHWQHMVCPLNIPVSTLNSLGLSWRALGWAWLHPACGWINVCRICSRN